MVMLLREKLRGNQEVWKQQKFAWNMLRIISIYTELSSLELSDRECVTEYMIRAESAATTLKLPHTATTSDP